MATEQRPWTDDILKEIRLSTERMSDLAEDEAWEDLLGVVRERHSLVERCLELECPLEEKRQLLESLQSLLRDDSMLIERCIKERDAARDNLAALGRARKASRGYQMV